MDEPDYNVVVDALEKHRDKLWKLTNSNPEWGTMDFIRMDQIATLDRAIDKLKNGEWV